MLPAHHRLRASKDFVAVLRGGRRGVADRLVVHVTKTGAGSPVVGFAVSKAVGNAVVRHRVARRLRAQLADRVGTFPAGSAIVVRALPKAAKATSQELASDLDQALQAAGL